MRTLNFYPGRGLPFLEAAMRPARARSKAKDTKAKSAQAQTATSARKTTDPRGRSALAVLAAPFGMLVRLMFSQVRLQREGKNLNFSLVEKGSEVPPPPPIDKALTDAQHLRAELKTLLDCHRKTRRVLRHLAYIERALATQGTKVMAEAPIEVLSIALGQFEALVSNWSNPALAELRSKMAAAIKDRSRDPIGGQHQLSNFLSDSRLQVGDVSHSMFMELERQYQHVLPETSIRAALDPVRSSLPSPSAVCTSA
jgi:hypothetical protein